MEKISLKENETIEYLSRDTGLVVSPEHTFGTDALLLADFAAPKRNDIACDLGTGCGIIPMIWCRDNKCAEITAVEIQTNACDQLSRSIAANGLSDKLSVCNIDLKSADTILKKSSFDLVTMNPPYKAKNTGIESVSDSDKIARHETMCNIGDITLAASKLLKFGGRFCVCIRPERLFETMKSMSDHKIEPKRLRFVSAYPETAPWLCLIGGKLGAKSGMTVSDELFLYKEKNVMSEKMLAILGKYREDM